MAKLFSFFLICTSLTTHALASVLPRQALGYAPRPVQCPSEPLTRSVQQLGDISEEERCYYNARKPITAQALKHWFCKIGHEHNITFYLPDELPVLGLALSGGGDRSALTGAGVVQAYDNREVTQTGMSGLYQAFTYHAALSGGNELLGSLSYANWPTITELLNSLWLNSLTHPRIYPAGTQAASQPIYAQFKEELIEKVAAGFEVSLTDIIGRLYGFAWLGGPDGAPNYAMSDIVSQSNFTSHMAPFPIHMTVNEAEYGLGCPTVQTNNSQFEMTPYEFGSWDPGVEAFSKMKYLGSMPQSKNLTCVTGFDKLGYLMQTSGDAPGLTCQSHETELELENATDYRFEVTQATFKSLFPNPFYLSDASPAVKDFDYLYMADGGGAAMGVSVWPLIHRPFIDIIFVSDNTNGTTNVTQTHNSTSGASLYNTYARAQQLGITTMPEIPPTEEFIAKGYNQRNVFFGCNDPATKSIVYMPDKDYVFDSTDFKTNLRKPDTPSDIQGLIANGALVGTNNNAADWPVCVGCLILKKTNVTMADECQQCFDTYCVT